jgi:tripartite-type tricarboxylate transporter receptor subunit TctC
MDMKLGNMHRMIIGVVGATLILWGTGERALCAEQFPTKPVQVTVPFTPGDTDNHVRPLIEKLPEFLGQPVSFVYKPGASGTLGAGLVAAAKPDGYTLLATSQSSLVVVPYTMKDLSYTLESFAPLVCFAEGPFLWVVKSDAPWKNLKELAEDAKRRPGDISFSASGIYSSTHLVGEAFAKEAGIKLNYIPSQGTGPAVTATLGGHIQIASSTIGPVLPHIKAGTMRALGIFGETRSKVLPDVPTFLESGYKVVFSSSYGILAPKRTPREIIEIYHTAAKKVLENHKKFVDDRLLEFGAQIDFKGPEEYMKFLRGQQDYVGKIMAGLPK